MWVYVWVGNLSMWRKDPGRMAFATGDKGKRRKRDVTIVTTTEICHIQERNEESFKSKWKLVLVSFP